MRIIQLKSTKYLNKVMKFLTSKKAFADIDSWDKTEVKYMITCAKKASNLKNGFMFIALEDENVIGYIDAFNLNFTRGGYIIEYMAVHKDYRRKGLGEKLLYIVEKKLKKEKARFMFLQTGDEDFYKPANKFWQKCGFIKVGHVPDYYFEGSGIYYYHKKL